MPSHYCGVTTKRGWRCKLRLTSKPHCHWHKGMTAQSLHARRRLPVAEAHHPPAGVSWVSRRKKR